jgi:cardiolipin synthase
VEQFVETWSLLQSRAVLVGILHFVLAAAFTAHALMIKRDVPAAIGWIGMAWLAPILGALLYVGFGINRVKHRARRLKGSVRSGARRPPYHRRHLVGRPA